MYIRMGMGSVVGPTGFLSGGTASQVLVPADPTDYPAALATAPQGISLLSGTAPISALINWIIENPVLVLGMGVAAYFLFIKKGRW